MLMRFVTTKQFIDSCIRRNDEDSDHQRPPLADEAQRNSGISSLVVYISTSIFYFIRNLLFPNYYRFPIIYFLRMFVSQKNKFRE